MTTDDATLPVLERVPGKPLELRLFHERLGHSPMTLAALAANLRAGAQVLDVHLEPGDSTRYTFDLIGRQDTPDKVLLVMRKRGHEVVGAAWCSRYEEDEVAWQLRGGNEWSARVIAWFLHSLFIALRAE